MSKQASAFGHLKEERHEASIYLELSRSILLSATKAIEHQSPPTRDMLQLLLLARQLVEMLELRCDALETQTDHERSAAILGRPVITIDRDDLANSEPRRLREA